MVDPSPIFIASPGMFILAMLLVAGIVGIGLWRRIRLPHLSRQLGIAGLAALALALADVKWQNEPNRRVVVMVDQSASTRGAAFQNAPLLNQRIDQLLSGIDPMRVDFNPALDGFVPPPASAVLLFSDGQFPIPEIAPPTFVAIDPTLNASLDAAIEAMEIRDDLVAIRVSVRGPTRTLTLTQGANQSERELAPGRYTITQLFAGGDDRITATISAGDLWPENDSMTIIPPPPLASERWWIGNNVPQSGWRRIPPAQLPTGSTAWLAPAVVVLNNVPADDLSPLQQASVQQYVRDLGGGLVILGGDRAFAAGHYTGTALDAISPLASTPPSPVRRWILLADASGSMAAPFAQSTRWNFAANAMMQTLQTLPPDDLVNIGSFARNLTWWSTGQSVRACAGITVPFISPSGPTNLEPVLQQIAAQANGSMPSELLILTDAEATITNAASLAAELRTKQIRLHLLATVSLSPQQPIAQLVQSTGGEIVDETNPRLWSGAAINLARSTLPDEIIRTPIAVRFRGNLNSLGQLEISLWNRTWLKSSAELLADARESGDSLPMCAAWQLGQGKVIAAAFPASASNAQAMADRVASPPRDPRLAVTWRPDSILVDAVDENAYLNDLDLHLRLDDSYIMLPQTAPGRYELQFEPPATPVLAELLHNDRVIDRRPLAGRYPREFDAIGNNITAMRDLARRTGGQIVPPEQTTPINLPTGDEGTSLTSWFSIASALLLGLALLTWKRMV